MFYTIYKITNKIDGKYYIGKHQTKDLNDGYMGSGKLIKRAIKKYGIQNFIKEILYSYNTEEEMNAKEKELVNISEETYNLCEGGQGGFGYINRTGKNIYENHGVLAAKNAKETVRFKRLTNEEYNLNYLARQKQVSNLGVEAFKQKYPNGIWLGKIHSEKTKRTIGEKNSKHQTGSGNSQYGSIWVTNGSENKKIRKEEIIPEGWYKGRKLK